MNVNEAGTSSRRLAGTLRTRLLGLLVSMAVVGTLGIAAAGTATAAPPVGGPVSQAVPAVVGGVPTELTMTLESVVANGNTLTAVGTLTGEALGDAAVPFAAPIDIAQSTGTCEILNLVLGPLHIDLLGLVIDLNQVVLNITAEQGPGNLLGNLLCAIAGLLDNPASPAGGLAGLLNRLLGSLFG